MLKSKGLLLLSLNLSIIYCSIIKRQAADDNFLCCRCVKSGTCETSIPENSRAVRGLTCQNEFQCFVATSDSNEGCSGCKFASQISTRSAIDLDEESAAELFCGPDLEQCCTDVETGLVNDITIRLGVLNTVNPLGVQQRNSFIEDVSPLRQAICNDEKARAVSNLDGGKICGKRDSRVYKHVEQPESFTNPGEWPWTVMIIKSDGTYIGAGAFIAKNTVVTVAHKVDEYVNKPEQLTVRLGDWKPNENAFEEIFDFEEFVVDCVRLHPETDLESSLANNVAILKFNTVKIKENTVKNVIDLRSGQSTPASYNAACLPLSSDQFTEKSDRCWVAAWGSFLDRQREIDMPLLSREQCIQRLGPAFEARNVLNWAPQDSELCAGGELGKDTCLGEGGAPLVCLDVERDQYYAVGLVNYGLGCNSTLPAVYTNLMDPEVNLFVKDGFRDDFCQK
jgi:hypothetical protein